MSKLLISHIDSDGVPPLLFAELFKDKLNFSLTIREDYGFEQDPEKYKLLELHDELIFADMSIPENVYDDLIKRGKHIEFYDHHESSKWIKERGADGVWDDSMCGSKIFWIHYVKPRIKRYNPIIEQLIDIVDTYDCWREESPLWEDAKGFNAVMYGGKGFYDWKATDNIKQIRGFLDHLKKKFETSTEWFWDEDELKMIDEGRRKENKTYENSVLGMQKRVDGKGRTFGIILIGARVSVVCSRILEDYPELDYLVAIVDIRGITGKISFRSKRENFDLNEIASAKGHKLACGGGFSNGSFCKKLWENKNMCFRYKDDPDYVEGNENTYLMNVLE